MYRRFLSLPPTAALLLASCTAAPKRDFVSDRVTVVTRGSGPDILLIPGLTGSREVWAGVADSLDDRYRLHLVQVNGFAGAAPGANSDGAVSAPVAEELARYIKETGLSRPAVIGHSMGGSIGMMLAARHPDLVGRLMVVDMVPFMGGMFGATKPDSLRVIADGVRGQILGAPLGEGMLAQMFQTMTLKEDMKAQLRRELGASDQRTVASAFHELIVTDLRPELSHITAPVTVLYVVPPNVTMPPEQFGAGIGSLFAGTPKARLARIDNSRHFIQWDQPGRFIAEVDALMKG